MLGKSIFNNKSELTAYGFACGFIEEKGNVKLYKEGGVYHVVNMTTKIYNSFDTLSEARKAYKHQFKLNKGKVPC